MTDHTLTPTAEVRDVSEKVTLTRETYLRLRERARVAEARYEEEIRFGKETREWARAAFDEARRLGDRCTFLYGEAMSRGATHEDLRGPDCGGT